MKEQMVCGTLMQGCIEFGPGLWIGISACTPAIGVSARIWSGPVNDLHNANHANPGPVRGNAYADGFGGANPYLARAWSDQDHTKRWRGRYSTLWGACRAAMRATLRQRGLDETLPVEFNNWNPTYEALPPGARVTADAAMQRAKALADASKARLQALVGLWDALGEISSENADSESSIFDALPKSIQKRMFEALEAADKALPELKHLTAHQLKRFALVLDKAS